MKFIMSLSLSLFVTGIAYAEIASFSSEPSRIIAQPDQILILGQEENTEVTKQSVLGEKKACENLAGETAAVNCGLGQKCPDGYNCCRGTGLFFCCPPQAGCEETDSRCRGTLSVPIED